MNPNPSTPAPPKSGLPVWIVCSVIFVLFCLMVWPVFEKAREQANRTWTASYGRQIVVCLKAWAGENGGVYPEAYTHPTPRTANEAFRLLFKAGIIEHELIFSAPASPYTNDNSIGMEPDFFEALEPGENHWCLVTGVSDNSDGNAPLIFENPASNDWPPVWNCDVAGQPKPGRAWKGGKIVIGLNDGSVTPESLESATGSAVPLKKDQDGKDLFTRWREKGSYLEVEHYQP